MSGERINNWHEANQRHLAASLAVVSEALKRHAEPMLLVTAETDWSDESAKTLSQVDRLVVLEDAQGLSQESESNQSSDESNQAADENSWGVDESNQVKDKLSPGEDEGHRVEDENNFDAPFALDHLSRVFSLSPFERDVLLMCAGVELDAAFAATTAAAQPDSRRTFPNLSLALAALPEAHWSAVTPDAPLRRWRLIEVEQGAEGLMASRLKIDERVLHYLVGVSQMDERLRGLILPVSAAAELPPSHLELAERIAKFCDVEKHDAGLPVVFLSGNDSAGKRAVAFAAAAKMNLALYTMRAADVPQAVAEREALARLWERESALQGAALLLEQDEALNTHAVRSFVENMRGRLYVAGHEMSRPRERALLRIDVNRPNAAEQQQLWKQALGPIAEQMDAQLPALISHFDFNTETIHAASLHAREALSLEAAQAPANALWEACRLQGRARLDDLAQRLQPTASRQDLVLPDAQQRSLHEIAAQVRGRATVYETWGFAAQGARGLGISALFTGASGTGKTMAAEVLARELQLDLYRIDLSQVVSKYIGETEKNLRHVFDAAEESGAVLLFDEADALFGKRSEVKDSHDRYANIEVSYLLQRMEAYRGLAILTTNLKTTLDTAFLRRLRFIVQFPFPDAAQRAEIWRRIFPSETPTENLDAHKLARLNITGGSIRNIALNAAFLAAAEGQPVTMTHLLRAARGEYDKLEKPLTEAESGGWR
jgi:hypothetical protein